MLLECQNCGAPLDASPQATIVRCNYCGMSNQVGAARTVAPQTPPGWRPPPVWTPPQHFPAESTPIRYSGRSSGAPVVFVAIGAAALVALGAIYAVTGAVNNAVSGAPSPITASAASTASTGGDWDGKSTLECGMGQSLVVDGRTVTLEHDTVINASMGCKLTIRNSTLKGSKVIEASQGTRITIENSTLEGTQAVIAGSQVTEIHVEKHSTLKSNETAIDVGQASKIYLVDSSVDAAEIAIQAGQNSRVDAEGSKIHGGQKSIKTGQNATLVLRTTTIQGKRDLGPRPNVQER